MKKIYKLGLVLVCVFIVVLFVCIYRTESPVCTEY